MAVAFDARSEGVLTAGDTSLTIPHTCAGGTDCFLYAAIAHTPGEEDVDAVTATYNGTAMDILFTDTATHAARHVRVFRLGNPSSGENNLVFSWTASRRFAAVAASFTGVDSADPDDAHGLTDGTGGGTTASRATSSAAGDMVMDVLVLANSASSIAVTGGNTEINQVIPTSGPDDPNAIAASYEAGDTSTTTSWSWTGTIAYVQWAWNINAAAGGGSTAVPVFLHHLKQQGIA